ncbi:hypothetical protein [Aureimonas sp. SK2]|uniref:hypothetical protein n=1 Tax=Aureimonas sp. SK2 TaxID=3015992 RepID=UPI0024448E8C|nr:hypothetical protein [Aureimonas sp. SK2]
MAVRFEDLTPVQCRAMLRLTGWASDGEAIGCLESELPAAILEAVAQLERLGLAQVDVGWRGARWWRLTRRGELVRDRGEA